MDFKNMLVNRSRLIQIPCSIKEGFGFAWRVGGSCALEDGNNYQGSSAETGIAICYTLAKFAISLYLYFVIIKVYREAWKVREIL